MLPPTDEVKKLGYKAPVAVRFSEIFGRRKLGFQFGGAEGYIEKVASAKQHAAVMEDLKRRFGRIYTGNSMGSATRR